MRRRCSVVLTLLAVAAPFAPTQAQNLVLNPGFETVSEEGAIQQWTLPTYWVGELSTATQREEVRSGERAALLRTAPDNAGKHWGRIHGTQVPATAGLRYRFSVWAKGKGDLRLGVINYRPNKPNLEPYTWAWQEAATGLTGDWQEVTFEFEPVDVNVHRVTVAVGLEGEGAEAWLDDAALAIARRAEGEVRVTPGYAMVAGGMPAEIAVRVSEGEQPVTNGRITVIVRDPDEPRQEELALGADGSAVYRVETGTMGLLELAFVAADLGAMATANVDVVPLGTFQEFEAAARRADPGVLPAHLLFLGDSLTDFYRGWNYVDQVACWLQEVHGPAVTARNAGVGGDYITRVWQRLNGEPNVYRANAYEGLYDPTPTHIFIFLGHNDTKLTSGSGFTEPVVPLDQLEELMRQTVGKLREETGAKITLLSSTSSVYEITRPNAEKLLETRGAANLFGKPEALEAYNEVVRRLAEELGCGYLDVYEPTRTHPDKQNLFTADGVHLSLEGNHLIALQVLGSLAH